MVDYYALISPTIEPLANASPAERKVVYDRLITMLDQQLRAAEPPRSDKDILKERINLEAAIRRVERRIVNNRKNTAPQAGVVSEPARPVPAEPAVPTSVELPPQPEIDARAARDLESEIEPKPSEPLALQPAPPDMTVASEPLTSNGSVLLEEMTSQTPVTLEPEEPVAAAIGLPEAIEPEELTEPEVLTEPEGLTEPDTIKPDATMADDPASARPRVVMTLPTFNGTEAGFEDLTVPESGSTFAPMRAPAIIPEPVLAPYIPLEDPANDLRPGLPTLGSINPLRAGLSQSAKGLWLRIGILALVLLALASAIGGIAEYLAQRSAERAASRNPITTADAGPSEQKITDRLPIAADQPRSDTLTGTAATNASSPSGDGGDADLLIQRAILLEEPPGGVGDPKRTVGRVNWKLETLRSSVINSTDIGARATIDVSEAGLSASFVFRRNRDQSSANTHLIEITMTPSPDNPNGKIRDITVPEMRSDEKVRGTSLAGIAVPVADNIFLVGLNGLPEDMKHNIELLRERNWFMIPMRYSNGKRALLLFEKGKTGERVFEDAMQTWQ